jgi:glycosyltransferase involved in cell wall biosynthesis
VPERIKVCQVINAFAIGGAETVALDIARSLDPHRFESLVLAAIQPDTSEPSPMRQRFQDAGVETHALPARSFRDPRSHWALWRFFRRERPDVVHGHNRFSDLWSCRAARAAGIDGAIWTRHLVYTDMSSRQLDRYRRLAHRTPVVLAVSTAVREHCIATEGIAADRVEMVVNGIDTDRFQPSSAADRASKRRELGVGEDEWLLLFVGRLVEDKAPDAFVALVGALRRRGLPARGFVCGKGRLADDLTDDARAAGVEILGLRTDVPALLGACDLMVSTSRVEGLPLNIMEAMAAGAAFVGPDLEQIVQLVADVPELASGLYRRPPRHGEVPREQIDRWADLVATRLTDREQLRRLGERGRDVIRARFSLAKMVQHHEEIYTAIARGERLPDRPDLNS